MYYNRARYYDAQLGRFVSEDSFEGSVTNPLSLNLYTYCYNNPSYYIDPSGNSVTAAALPFAGGAAVADGPVPVGDAIGLGILGGALIIDGGIWVYHKVTAPNVQLASNSQPQITPQPPQNNSQPPTRKPPKIPPTLVEQIAKITAASTAIQQNINNWGIETYKDMTILLQKTGLHAHHIIPQRFANIIGMDPNKMRTFAVTPEQHQLFTNAWRTAIPYGTKPELKQIYTEASKIYKDFPEIIKIIKRAMEITGTK